MGAMAQSPIEDYALLSNCHSAALVSLGGSIDWLCLPRFDSAACFAALLGSPEHGRWLIAPSETPTRISRGYRGETWVLETQFDTAAGSVLLIDCMAVDGGGAPPQLVRVVKGLRGSVDMQLELIVRFDYGRTVPWVTRSSECLSATAGPTTLRLFTDVQTRGEGLKTVGAFRVSAGEERSFVLTYTPSHLPAERIQPAQDALAETEKVWLAWSARSNYQGSYREAVQRSLLTLKALTYQPTGGIVAAVTTSLPEQLGGTRNWDYRLCWLRDATITLYSLLVSGYTEEAESWRNWLLRAVAGAPEQIQILYGVGGERQVPELELPWLPGYADSRPVRIGNAAHAQLQLDTFGELMDAMYQCRHSDLENEAGWALEKRLLGYLEGIWNQPDEGIWEIRGPRRHFTHSKVMAWVAFDRAICSVEQFGREGPVERWRDVRAAIHADVCSKGYSSSKRAFTQSYGSDELDASLLLLPLVGFLPASDPRVKGTVEAIERELLVEDTFVLRYRTLPDLDGLPPGEGAFLPCSFWLVSNRIMQGRTDEARALFERLLRLRNDVGLLSEEYDPHERRLVGNFPQAFSHLALIDAAVSLSRLETDPASHRTRPSRTTQPQVKAK
jgi:GH15 family glucan-1,4-alpha-glucosidase